MSSSEWSTQLFLKHIVSSYDSKSLVLSCSFGSPEGMVLIDMMSELTGDLHVVTLDTGRLPEETYTLMDRARNKYDFRLTTLYPDNEMLANLVISHGHNGFYESKYNRKFCCQIRKVAPFTKFIVDNAIKANITGLRREHSQERGDIPLIAIDKPSNVAKISPLASWTFGEVWTYVRSRSLPYNALHDQGYESIGCAPCSRPGKGREGRWWWENDTVKECGLHLDKGSGI